MKGRFLTYNSIFSKLHKLEIFLTWLFAALFKKNKALTPLVSRIYPGYIGPLVKHWISR